MKSCLVLAVLVVAASASALEPLIQAAPTDDDVPVIPQFNVDEIEFGMCPAEYGSPDQDPCESNYLCYSCNATAAEETRPWETDVGKGWGAGCDGTCDDLLKILQLQVLSAKRPRSRVRVGDDVTLRMRLKLQQDLDWENTCVVAVGERCEDVKGSKFCQSEDSWVPLYGDPSDPSSSPVIFQGTAGEVWEAVITAVHLENGIVYPGTIAEPLAAKSQLDVYVNVKDQIESRWANNLVRVGVQTFEKDSTGSCSSSDNAAAFLKGQSCGRSMCLATALYVWGE